MILKIKTKYITFLNCKTRDMIKKRLDQINDDERVVPKGRRLITETLDPVLNKLFNKKKGGGVVSDRKQKVVIYTLRHTFVSHLAIKGVPIQIIQKLLNHKMVRSM